MKRLARSDGDQGPGRNRLDAAIERLLPDLPPRWRKLLGFLVVIIALQAVYWAVIQPVFLAVPQGKDIDRIAFVRTEIAELGEPTLKAAANASYKPVELPFTDCCDRAYFALRLTFQLPAVPPEGLGMVTVQQVDNFILLVNGSTVLSEGRMEFGNQTFHGQQPKQVRFPSGLLQQGDNQITLITVRDGFPYTDLYPPILAPYEQIVPWAAFRMWQMTDLALLSGFATFLMGLFALLMLWRTQDRLFAFWLSALCFSWSALFAYGLVLSPPFGGMGRMIAFFAINSLVSASLLGFIDAWTGRSMKWLQCFILLAWFLFAGGAAIALHNLPMPVAYDSASSVWVGFSLAFGALVVVRLIWHFVSIEEPRRLEAALLSIIGVCVIADGIGEVFGSNAGGYLLEGATLLLVAIIAAFLQRNFTLFQSSFALNTMLGERLSAREAELSEVHSRERERVRREAHDDERRRIMRDMHDGLGSQLMGMLLSARRGVADPEKTAEGLQSVIDEMRLMIDSMDSVGESLGSALMTFHDRVRPRVEASGFALDWINTVDNPLPDYAPRAVLQVFRVLQEAVTNALKHSGGDRITVSITRGDDGRLSLIVADNGSGLKPSPHAGRGLRNMQTRASLIGATLTVAGDETGTRICMSLSPSIEAL